MEREGCPFDTEGVRGFALALSSPRAPTFTKREGNLFYRCGF